MSVDSGLANEFHPNIEKAVCPNSYCPYSMYLYLNQFVLHFIISIYMFGVITAYGLLCKTKTWITSTDSSLLPLVHYFRSIDCKTQLEQLNKNCVEANTKVEPESALSSQVSARCD